MKAIYFILMLMLIPAATAETGIVLNESNYVVYKFDTPTAPTLNSGEYIIYAPNINDVHVRAWFNGSVFFNPVSTLNTSDRDALKDAYIADMADLDTIRNTANPSESQQNWAIKKEAEILQRVLRFLKWVFW